MTPVGLSLQPIITILLRLPFDPKTRQEDWSFVYPLISEEFKAEVVDLGEIVAAILWNRDVQAYLNAKAPSIRVRFAQSTPMVMLKCHF